MDSRKRLSGAQYRKLSEAKKQKAEDDVRTSLKIDSFFKPTPTTTSTSTTTSTLASTTSASASITTPSTSITTPSALTSTKNGNDQLQHANELNISNSVENDKNERPINLNDPATWVLKHRADKETIIDEILSKSEPVSSDFFKNANFEKSERVYKIGNNKTKSRHLIESYFYSELPNGERTIRDWLRYSSSTGKVFCISCILFGDDTVSSYWTSVGFNDWKNARRAFGEHERGHSHRHNTLIYVTRRNKQMAIDRDLKTQYEKEKAYWRSLLERIIEVVKFLSSRGLPFRGNDCRLGSVHNGLYLGTLELLAKYDDFLRQHLDKYGNPGIGNVSYLSSTICDEIIVIMGQKMCEAVINEINESKYYSIIVDSTPDCAHIDQLTIVFRYISSKGEPVERFYTFVPIESHTAVSLEETIFKLLEDTGIKIENCRGQCYDNAANMSGVYGGLQALIKQHNELAHGDIE